MGAKLTKVLFYGEPPVISTGLSRVSRHTISIFQSLGWEIETVCINQHVGVSYEKEPYKINPSTDKDGWNRGNASRLIRAGDYDVLFFSCDCGNIDFFYNDLLEVKLTLPNKKIIAYTPLDCDEIHWSAFKFTSLCDLVVVYTNHARNRLGQIIPGVPIRTIYLGCDSDFFHVVTTEEKKALQKKWLGYNNKFVVINANRNQWRKDIGRCMYAFMLFHKLHPDSILYLHMQTNDVGGNLMSIAASMGLDITKDILFTGADFNHTQGYGREQLRELYQMSDLFFSTSTGEGWGLTVSDAMSCGVPVLVPHNTAHLDLVGENSERGFFIDCGGPDNWMIKYGNTPNDTINRRDTCSVTSAVDKLKYCYSHPHEMKEKAAKARAWAEIVSWQAHEKMWIQLLKEEINGHS